MPRSMIKRLLCVFLCIVLALSTVAFAENIARDAAVYSPLKYEMHDSDEVRAMQTRLKELGFFSGSPTGGYYSATADAVQAFQEAAGLEINRRCASSEMLELLYSDDAPMKDGVAPTPVPVSTPEVVGVLKYGMKDNAEVRQAQRRLAELGYFNNSVTGNFFDATKDAFEAFQKKAGFEVNGRLITREVLNALLSESAPAIDWMPSDSATSLPTATPRPELTKVPGATPRPALFYGDTSEAIREMQLRLKDLRYFDTEASGSYWAATVEAVAAFQEAVGLPVNGRVADTMTLEKLFSNDAPVMVGKEETKPFVNLYFGQSGNEQIRSMQERLRELGYFDDVSTGSYYLKTADAVGEFQKATGITENKYVATIEMLRLLYSDKAPVYDPNRPLPTNTPAPTATPDPTSVPTQSPYKELKYGMSDSDAVSDMQVRLRELGYLKATPTGGYWSQTVKAVKAFLKDNGMEGDGKVATIEMQALLFADKQPDQDEEDEATSYETLTYGMQNNAAVKAVQARLRALGYFAEEASGNYFGVTTQAVEAFQKAAGLPVDGNTVTPDMQELLFSANAPSADSGATPPVQTPQQPTLNTNYNPLKYGMQGSEEVRAMQNKLKERGFMTASATGGYFDATKKAVAAFQTYAKLPVNGKEASSQMLGYLFYDGDLDALIANGGVIPPVNGGQNGSVGGDTNDGTVVYDPAKYKDAKTDVLLCRGDKGEQVNFLIMRLSELGYLESKTPTEFDGDVAAAVKWFQNTNMLDSDGIAGPKTLGVLYSDKAISADEGMKDNVSSSDPTEVEGERIEVSIGTVLNIDWFSDRGTEYYNRRSGKMKDGAIVILTDVSTGVSFRAKRSGGYNHADMEPLTDYDTWVMYQIYGGEWSWKRHAVYVTLSSGETLAGSMNGMPHGSSSISDNNFDGHFCVHFLNSRTHGTDKVDPDHQAAVKRAAG